MLIFGEGCSSPLNEQSLNFFEFCIVKNHTVKLHFMDIFFEEGLNL